jgi:hypothetical protein
MSKKLNYIVGAAMVAIGIILVATTYKIALRADKTFVLFLCAYMSLIGGGLLLIWVTREVHKAAENLQRIEQSIETPGQEQPAPQIIITIASNGINVMANGMTLPEIISTLEISKLQMINQHITAGLLKKP